MCKDIINDLIIENVSRANEYDAILACQDNCIRIIQVSQLYMEIPLSASVNTVASLTGEDHRLRRGPLYLIYGLNSGEFGAIKFEENNNKAGSGELQFSVVWSLFDNDKRSAINCIRVFDLTKNGTNEIIIGRDDGRIEVYAYDNNIFDNPPRLAFSHDIGKFGMSIVRIRLS